MENRSGWKIVPDGKSFRMENRSGWEIVPDGKSFRMGNRSGWEIVPDGKSSGWKILRMENRSGWEIVHVGPSGIGPLRVADAQTGRPYSGSIKCPHCKLRVKIELNKLK
jgi:hypothetical protein